MKALSLRVTEVYNFRHFFIFINYQVRGVVIIILLSNFYGGVGFEKDF